MIEVDEPIWPTGAPSLQETSMISIKQFTTASLIAISAAYAAPVNVQNAGFESADLSVPGFGTFSQILVGSTLYGFSDGTLDDWNASATMLNSAAGGFSPSNEAVNWSSKWWLGNNIAYLQIEGPGSVSLIQNVNVPLNDFTAYRLTVDIGRRNFSSAFNYSIELFAGSTLLASASNLALGQDSSGTDSFEYLSGGTNPLAGQPLSIVLKATGTEGFGLTEAFFDNVRLSADPKVPPPPSGVPEPGTFALAAVGALFLRCLRKG